jgi:hypothetical protein
MGVRVPNFVPDGLNRACRWPPVEDGGSSRGNPTCAPRSLNQQPRLHKAGRGHPAGRGFLDQRRRADRRELTAIRLAGSTTETM